MPSDSKSTSKSIAPPPRLEPVVTSGVSFAAEWGSPQGVVTGTDAKSQKKLWTVSLYETYMDPALETDAGQVFIHKMEKGAGQDVIVTDSAKRQYLVKPDGRHGLITWPVSLALVRANPLTVELTIMNSLARPLSFDKPSVGFGGNLSNNLFLVSADGVAIPYRGMMKKRAPPDEFLVLKPGEIYKVKIDLSETYAVPAGAKNISVAFEHTNHFSPDSFRMVSPEPLAFALPE